jgi:GMP synthase (glutamine-hydrolysing)
MICDGLGSLAGVLDKAGIEYRYIDTYREDFSDFDPELPDLLIVLGGSPGVYQADHYPFLKEELLHIEKRLERNMPVLGICLGAQMMAKVMGSNVFPGPQGSERGWYSLKVNEKGKQSAVRHLDEEYTQMVCWHGDTFDLPKGATLLASTDMYENQIFSYGKNILGLQCHAEVTPCILKGWFVSSASRVANGELDLEDLRSKTEQHAPVLINQTEKFLLEWLDQIEPIGQ